MKKQIILSTAVILSAGMLLTTGCKKEDSTSPVVALTGKATETSILNVAWVDAGATATDDEDGKLDVTVTGKVNKDLAGVYVLTYSATDAAGNTGTQTRTVTVYNEAEVLAGNYDVNETYASGIPAYKYTQTVSASTTLNGKIHFNKFGDYLNNTAIYATVSATTITLPSQTGVGIGTKTENHTFSGAGTITGANFTIVFTDVNLSQNNSSETCTAVFTKK